MKWSKYAAALLALNLGLLAAVGYLVFKLRSPLPAGPVAVAPEPMARPLATMGAAQPPKPRAALDTSQLSWRQLESEDYRTYIERLRSIGCPEQTIRDIVIADVDNLMAPRVQAILPYRKELKYWQPEEDELWNNYDPREWLRQQREVEFEKREVIHQLLGVDLVGERLRQQGREDYHSRRLSFLPEAKRGPVRSIIDKYNDQELALREKEWEEGEPLTAEDRAHLQRLRQERQAALAQALSPAEMQQYELWLGYTASKVREAVYGMDATEEEFLKIYSLRRSFDQQWNPQELDLDDPAVRARWDQANRELDAQIRRQLGEPRYALYERGQDPDFRALHRVAARYKLPPATPAEAYAYKKIVQEARDAVASNPTLSPEQKEQALKEVGEETEKAIKEALGEKAYNYYRRHGHGLWIRN
jgi:hypothetical protein